MQKSDWLLLNATVLTMDSEFTLFEDGAIAIQGDSIVAVGNRLDLITQFEAGNVLDCGGKVILPGLVNAHTHAPMTLLRGLADDLRLDVWLMGYMMPVEREFVSPDFTYLGTSIACAEMIRSGVTAFADMYYFEDSVAKAARDAGIRALCGQTVLKFPSPDAESYEESLARAREFIVQWKDDPLIIPAVSPHAPYTCTPDILRACADLALEFDVPLHTHISETALEVENMRRDEGMPVVPYIRKFGLLETKLLAAHCVHIDKGEMRTLHNCGAGVAHNPSSNLKLASGIAPVPEMLATGLNVGIGTDGPASNNDLDMIEEIRLAAFLAKTSGADPTLVPARQALLMATRMGAQALHIAHLTGSLEPGKRADLIVFDLDPLHNSPRFRRDADAIYAQIVYASKATDVSDVMVNGRWLMRDRLLHTLDESALREASREYAKQIDTFLISREQSVLSKLIAIGGAMEEESFEIQLKAPIESREAILQKMRDPQITMIRIRHYGEYDTYLSFQDPDQGVLRYREDDFIDEHGTVINVRSRLTLVGSHEHHLSQAVLSRTRFFAPAANSLRFYKEYFKPVAETVIEKDRLRYLVEYRGIEFFINLDEISTPSIGKYLEIKTRTWSRRDAEKKAVVARELFSFIGGDLSRLTTDDYIDMVKSE